jgi:uncharacterized protein (DUF362 family)
VTPKKQSRAKVAIAEIRDRKMRQQSVENSVRKAIDLLGGIGKFVKPGDIVGLKPNQTLFKLASEGSTTSPKMIIALTKLCKEAGAKDVWIIEAAGHAQLTRHVCSITGMAAAAQEAGARMIYLDEIAQKIVDFGEDARVRYMPVPEALDRIDAIIDCPKAKTHFVDPISCACKNWFGIMPMAFRLNLQRDADPYYWGNTQLLQRYKPRLTVCDGMIAGSGQGPGSNKPFWWGHILASEDPVALDVTVARLFTLDWQNIRVAKDAAEHGVGIYEPERTDIVGVKFEKAQIKVQPADPSVHRYPCRVIVGRGATIEGTLGHWKTIADAWLDSGLWSLFTSKGQPTFMFGDAEDPDFEAHVQEGPYVVLDDSAQDLYKYDPRVTYVPGSPVPQSYMQHEMVQGMGFGEIYSIGLRMYELETQMKGRISGTAGSATRKKTITRGLVGAAAVAAAIAVPAIIRSREREEPEEKIAPSI